jgi:hypothetical protein
MGLSILPLVILHFGSNISKITMTEIWGGSGENDERRTATANQVRDMEKGQKQKLLGMESAVEDILSLNLFNVHSAR